MIAVVVPALLMGLAGGAHCVTMCGGVTTAACGTASASLGGRARYAVAFNAGRVLTYSILGAAAGGLGSIPMAVLPLDVARIALRVVAALLLLGLGLHLAGVTSVFGKVEILGEPLWRRVAPLARRLVPVRSTGHAAMLGAAWAFVPCGLVYGALSLAIGAGSASLGALTMLAFGAGTIPVMTVVATVLGSVVRRLATGWARRAAGLVVVVLAVQQGMLVADEVDLASAVSLGGGAPSHVCCHGKK